MDAILNALFGTYPQPEQQTVTTDTNQAVAEQSAVSTSSVADNVQIKSVISSEVQANATTNTKLNMDSLLAQLSTTHAQVDQYSRTRTAEINEQVQKSISDILGHTQHQQEELLAIANQRHLTIDNEYQIQLQKVVEALDGVKAKTLADLERDLQAKQQLILDEAKKQIDHLNDQAHQAKLELLIETNVQDKVNIDNLADQVVAIGQQETQHLLQSTTTTVITSQTQATGHTQTVVATGTIDTTTAHIQSQVASKSSAESVSTLPNTTAVDSVTKASNLSTTSISPIAAAANVTLDSNVVASIVSNASARSKNKTVEPVAATTPVTSNKKAVDPIAAAANVTLDSNVVASIVADASVKSKNKTAEPAAPTTTGVTSNNNIVDTNVKSP